MNFKKKLSLLKSNPSFGRIFPLCLMIAGGGLSIAISHFYTLNIYTKSEIQQPVFSLEEVKIAFPKPAPAETEEAEEKDIFEPTPEQFNLAFCFSEETDISDPMKSKGGIIYARLSAMEAEWLGNIYNYASMTPTEAASRLGIGTTAVLGKYDRNNEDHVEDDPATWVIPDWKTININVYNGNGTVISQNSNLKEILSMASVYTYYHDYDDEEAFFQYAKQLWDDSHSFRISLSNVYYCDGCIDAAEEKLEYDGAGEETGDSKEIDPVESETAEETETEESNETFSSESRLLTATPGEIALGPGYYLEKEEEEQESQAADEEYKEEVLCPGHVDLNISIYINGLDEGSKSLYSLDKTGNISDSSWPGWTEETRSQVSVLREKDWQKEYGILIFSNISTGIALGSDEIDNYMGLLPDGISQTRRDLIRFALESVGKVPYYWGGKPAARDYAGNRFGSVVAPDESGRVLKGLDCSGWVNWVYWSVTGSRLPYESTAGLINCGTAIQPEQLQPGDILIRRGEEAHVVMFLAWSNNGNIICVHESSGSSDNVAVEEKPFNWEYCRKLVE